MQRSVIFVPSRNRPQRFVTAVSSILQHTSHSDIIACLDEDDHFLYPRMQGVQYAIGPKPIKLGLNEKLNRMARNYMNDYDYILWAADDTVVCTPNWDEKLIAAIKKVPMGISYPDDVIQREKLPSNGTCFDSSIVKALGYLAPPKLLHLYIDDFWKLLGDSLETLRYCPDVVVKHEHFIVDKSKFDFLYQETNSQERFMLDEQTFIEYQLVDFGNNVKKLKEAINK